MSDSEKWNARFADSTAPGPPSDVLALGRHWLPATGRALDLACGPGGNGTLLAEAGLNVHLWDISERALDVQQQYFSGLGIEVVTERRDCERAPPTPASFEVICVSRFLHRPLCPHIADALTQGGVLFYQTFLIGARLGPSNPDFLLRPGELPLLFEGLHQWDYRESPQGMAMFIATKR